VKSDIARRLIDLNRAFYQTFAAPFAATRVHVQPGAQRLLDRIPPGAAVADLGCGNGNAAGFLAGHGHTGRYLGLDLSAGLLEIARGGTYPFPAEFRSADFFSEGWDRSLPEASFPFALAFAVLHHIPGEPARAVFLAAIRRLLDPKGIFFLSNWRFLRSPKLRERIVPWEEIGLQAAAVDAGDYLLDWRSEGRGLRYVHIIEETERLRLAEQAGFREIECFESDGEGGNLADYAVWTPVSPSHSFPVKKST
jgi:tRNA (uracil-5-)-methyltransferase TRM9